MAFNNDSFIQDEVRRIVTEFGIDTFIETGTYRAQTTLFMSNLVKKVITIELNPKYYNLGKEVCRYRDNVELKLGDSRQKLEETLKELRENSRILIYLDAHWNDDWPLNGELEIISRYFKGNCFIMIDDIKVPHIPYIQYDKYVQNGKMKDCDYEFIKEGIDKVFPLYEYYYSYRVLDHKKNSGKMYFYPKSNEWNPKSRLFFTQHNINYSNIHMPEKSKNFILYNSHGLFSNIFKILSWADYYENSNQSFTFYVMWNSENIRELKNVNIDETKNLWTKVIKEEQSLIDFPDNFVNGTDKYPDYEIKEGEKMRDVLIEKGLKYRKFFKDFVDTNYYYGCSKIYKNKEEMGKYLEYYRELYKKYIKNPETKTKTNNKTVLGVYIRAPVHHKIETHKVEEYYSEIMTEIDKIQSSYDLIYVSTQVKPIYELLGIKYLNKMIRNDEIKRINKFNEDWEEGCQNLEEEYISSLREAEILGKSDYILGSPSNYFLGALLFASHTNYKIYDYLVNSEAW